MKTKSFLTIALIALLSVVACKRVEPDTPKDPAQNLTIKFTASLYEFTKATDTSFENGDVIGVNVFNPECYLYNAQYTYNDGNLTAAVANEWYDDADLEATITAVYPRLETTEASAENQSFTINADQSTKAGYTTSDLMLAKTTSKPTADAVKLPFKHALSKIVITIDNKIGEEIAQIWFADVQGGVTYQTADPLATLTTTGTAGTIKAYKSGNNTWQLIVAPQTASPKLALTTASGKQFTFVLSENVTFTSGKVSTATVEVSEESIYTAFTPEITDWVADNELNFNQEDVDIEIPEEEQFCRLIVKVNKAITWYDKYIYSWDDLENKLSGEWPGTKTSWDKEDGDYYVYYYDFPYSLNGTTFNYIINNGNGGKDYQTKDLTVTLGEQTTVIIESTDVKVTD